MALYAFDGTGDNWDTAPARNADLVTQNDAFNKIGPKTQAGNGRFLTNVVLFAKEYNQSGVGSVNYFAGVGSGSRIRSFLYKIIDLVFGGAFGFGAKDILTDAKEALKRSVKKNDETIDIIAYSRGAAIARIFVDEISTDYSDYGFSKAPQIRFLGLFDTVASLGNPLSDIETLPKLIFQECLPDNVKNAFHAMSRDLNRIGFGLDRAYGKNLVEVWFRGGHGDIGGNSTTRKNLFAKRRPNRGRTNITLNFMIRKAIASEVGLKPQEFLIDLKAPIIVDRFVTLNPLDWGNPGAGPSRQHTNTDVFHFSFFDKDKQIKDNRVKVPYKLKKENLIIEEISDENKNYRLVIQKINKNRLPD
ncbi:phospholipase effector Tle1 domain-containing protein [Acaryochloris marina NIES-2412]|uniref:phospholipase effector Tle1 domain-containing protein n=1 Tax=Acaryochloris marina TaxID=155978 RepID=UPI0040596025